MSISKIVCWNVNGIRALKGKVEAFKGSFKAFLDSLEAEVFVFQETKVGSTMKDIEESILHIDGYESFWSLCTRKPGYSGVATFVKKGLTVDAKREFGRAEFDCEGRVMMTDHGSFVLFNVYFPNSGNGDRLDYKMEFYRWFEGLCDEYLKQGRQIIVAGDVNTTHGEIDIWCPEKLKQGLFEVERKWMDHLFYERSENGEAFVDTFRYLHPTARKYSWWDVKQNLRITDQGYRLDYFIVNKKFLPQIVDSEMMTDQLGSDHCPLYIKLLPQPVPPTNKLHILSSEKIRASQPKISSFFTKLKRAPTPQSPTASSSHANLEKDTMKSSIASPILISDSPSPPPTTTTTTATATINGLESFETTSKDCIEQKEKRERPIVGDRDENEPEPKRPKFSE